MRRVFVRDGFHRRHAGASGASQPFNRGRITPAPGTNPGSTETNGLDDSSGYPPVKAASTPAFTFPPARKASRGARCSTTTEMKPIPIEDKSGFSVFYKDENGDIFHTVRDVWTRRGVSHDRIRFPGHDTEGPEQTGAATSPDSGSPSRPVQCRRTRQSGRAVRCRGELLPQQVRHFGPASLLRSPLIEMRQPVFNTTAVSALA